jgi:type IV secretion system protein VirB8
VRGPSSRAAARTLTPAVLPEQVAALILVSLHLVSRWLPFLKPLFWPLYSWLWLPAAPVSRWLPVEARSINLTVDVGRRHLLTSRPLGQRWSNMAEDRLALPVLGPDLSTYYKEVESFQRARASASKRMSKVLGGMVAISLIANLGQAWTIASLLPLTKLVPVYLWVRADGSVDSSVALSRLPATQSDAVIDAALWEYVRLREGYSFDSARYGYDAVSGMSNDSVRTEYQRWFNYPNPTSPQVIIGRKGQIDVEHIGSARIAANVEQIRYRRVDAIQGQQPLTTTWTATLQFETASTLPALSRLSNPGGVIVTSYQAEEDGAQ